MQNSYILFNTDAGEQFFNEYEKLKDNEFKITFREEWEEICQFLNSHCRDLNKIKLRPLK